MALITFKIRIKADGKPEVDLPEDLPVGEYTATLQVNAGNLEDNSPLSSEEIAGYLQFEGKTGQEIVEMGLLGGWEDMGIEDSVVWIQEQRRKRKQERGNRW